MGERLRTEGLTPAEVKKKQEMGHEYNSGRRGNYRQGLKEAPREGSALSSGHGRTIAKAKSAGAKGKPAERDGDSETATTARSRIKARQDRPVFKVVAAAVLTRLGPRAREGGAD